MPTPGYAKGYQDALREILEIAEADGAESALKYAQDNCELRLKDR